MKLEGNPSELVAFLSLLKSAEIPNKAYLGAPLMRDEEEACDGDCDDCGFGLLDKLDALHEKAEARARDERWREAIQFLIQILRDED